MESRRKEMYSSFHWSVGVWGGGGGGGGEDLLRKAIRGMFCLI